MVRSLTGANLPNAARSLQVPIELGRSGLACSPLAFDSPLLFVLPSIRHGADPIHLSINGWVCAPLGNLPYLHMANLGHSSGFLQAELNPSPLPEK